MKLFFITYLTILASFNAAAQKDTLTISGEAAKEIIRKINIDTAIFLSQAGNNACKCIDSISLSGKGKKEIAEEINTCIDKEVAGYQVALKIYHSMVDAGKNNEIRINTNKESDEYIKHYYEIERWLNDSCKAFRIAAATNDRKSENSVSKDPVAIDYYEQGVTLMQEEKYKDAESYFVKAVQQDKNFAFAWDNLGICRRKQNNLDGAIEAYNKSLEIDPLGMVPLQNIAIVYIYKKDYDNAIKAYERMATIHPDDPEIYYGIGAIYTYNKPDMEKALRNLCKAYNLYADAKSPYRSDAEKLISTVYAQMKKDGKEDLFYSILKEYHLNPSGK